jgi:hypothetical protein
MIEDLSRTGFEYNLKVGSAYQLDFVKGGIVELYLRAIALFCIITHFLIENPSRRYFRQVSEKLN